jgi:hypothetical protein
VARLLLLRSQLVALAHGGELRIRRADAGPRGHGGVVDRKSGKRILETAAMIATPVKQRMARRMTWLERAFDTSSTGLPLARSTSSRS